MSTVLVLNGPNLGRLGTREPDVYGSGTLEDLRRDLDAEAHGWGVDLRQTDDEARLIGWLHEAADTRSPVLLNAGAWTHYSYAVSDAVALVTSSGVPVLEVHLTNPHAREEFRHTSVLSPVVTGVVSGFGLDSYLLAFDWVRRRASGPGTIA